MTTATTAVETMTETQVVEQYTGVVQTHRIVLGSTQHNVGRVQETFVVLQEITKDQHPKAVILPPNTFPLATEPEQVLAAFLRSGEEMRIHLYHLNDKATQIYHDNPERFLSLFSMTVDQRAITAYRAMREQSQQQLALIRAAQEMPETQALKLPTARRQKAPKTPKATKTTKTPARRSVQTNRQDTPADVAESTPPSQPAATPRRRARRQSPVSAA